jgi:hypothetical protein
MARTSTKNGITSTASDQPLSTSGFSHNPSGDSILAPGQSIPSTSDAGPEEGLISIPSNDRPPVGNAGI